MRMLVSLLVLIICFPVQAQYLPLQHYSKETGLAHSNVFRIFQDSKGFLWFCTDNGVSRFNGQKFENYFSYQSRTANSIMSMTEGPDGRYYFATYGGGISFLKDTLLERKPLNEKSSMRWWAYTVLNNGSHWMISLRPTLTLFQYKNRQLLPRYPGGNTACKTYKIRSEGHNLLLPTSNGLFKIEGDTLLPLLPNSIGNAALTDIATDKLGGYWAALTREIVYIKDDQILFRYPLPSTGQVSDMLVDLNNDLWVAVANFGIYRIRNRVMEDMTAVLKLDRIIVNDLFQDSEGHIWIATHGQGVYKIKSLNTRYYPIEESKINLYCNSIKKLDDSSVVIGSVGTVSVWKNGTIRPLISHSFIPMQNVYDVALFDNKIWIGTTFNLYSTTYPEINPQQHRIYKDEILGVISLHKLYSGEGILIGGYNNIYQIRANASIPQSFADNQFAGKRINTIGEDKAGNIYVGTDSALIVYRNGQLNYLPLPGITQGTTVRKVVEDRVGRIWIATYDGLFCKINNQIIRIALPDATPYEACNDVYADDKYLLWVSGIKGLSCIDLKTMTARKMYNADYPDEIRSICRIGDQLFLGTINGFYLVELQKEQNLIPELPLYITAASNTSHRKLMPVQMSIGYKEKLRIEFVALHYGNRTGIEYRYKVEGLNKEWSLTENTEVELQALPPGNYEFLLEARLGKGAWLQQASLPITVQTPFFRTAWFMWIMILLMAGLVIAAVRYLTLRRERKQTAELNALNKIAFLRQQALSALINPHFIFNCMNSIQHYLNRKDLDAANKYLADFAKLIRLTMENAQDAFITLEREITRIKLYLSLEQLRFGEDLRYEFDIDPQLQNQLQFIPNMILQPYIENAIWHGIMPKGGAGTIRISIHLSMDGNEITVTIADDGIGYTQGHTSLNIHGKHRSMGMALTEERLRLLEHLLHKHYRVRIRQLVNMSGQSMGTEVQIQLPARTSPAEMEKISRELP
jgi:ligand-binding sensor domain-containing protein